MKNWKVSYECVQDKAARRPFWKRSTVVEAPSRKDAIAKVQAMFSPPRYGNYRASVTQRSAARI